MHGSVWSENDVAAELPPRVSDHISGEKWRTVLAAVEACLDHHTMYDRRHRFGHDKFRSILGGSLWT